MPQCQSGRSSRSSKDPPVKQTSRVSRADSNPGLVDFNVRGVMMKAVVISRPGPPDVLKIEERPEPALRARSEEHTSELQSLMRLSSAVFCLKKKINNIV